MNGRRTRSVVIVACVVTAACSDARPSEPAKAQEQAPSAPRDVNVVTVRAAKLDRTLVLPGELLAFQDVALHSRVQGFVKTISVDRGSKVRRGQVLATIVAPELTAQRSEADAKAQSAKAQRAEAEARLLASQATSDRLKKASQVPGVVSGNELDVAQQTAEADKARVELLRQNESAAAAAAAAVKDIESYLRIVAPFDGVVTERGAHPGTLVGPSLPPIVRVQQVDRLRLVVPIPETSVADVPVGTAVKFKVPSAPGEQFEGRVSRVSGALDPRTRTMAVELDVSNRDGVLGPGMFPQVTWPVHRAKPSLWVPPAAVATTTERSFVVRIRNDVVEWVDVTRGASVENAVEVFGDLKEGDQVAARGTDELRPGTRVHAKTPAPSH